MTRAPGAFGQCLVHLQANGDQRISVAGVAVVAAPMMQMCLGGGTVARPHEVRGVKLNAPESVELGRQVLAKQQVQLIQQWLDQDKLEGSEELGDMIKSANPQLALKVYLLGKCHDKVIMGLAEGGQQEKIMPYCTKVEYAPDWTQVVGACIRMHPTAAQQLAINAAAIRTNSTDGS